MKPITKADPRLFRDLEMSVAIARANGTNSSKVLLCLKRLYPKTLWGAMLTPHGASFITKYLVKKGFLEKTKEAYILTREAESFKTTLMKRKALRRFLV